MRCRLRRHRMHGYGIEKNLRKLFDDNLSAGIILPVYNM